MIVRIIGEGQWRVDTDDLDSYNSFDDSIEQALGAGDQEALTAALTQLLDSVRAKGEALADDELVDSDVILPDASVTLEQMQEFLDAQNSSDGLIPG